MKTKENLQTWVPQWRHLKQVKENKQLKAWQKDKFLNNNLILVNKNLNKIKISLKVHLKMFLNKDMEIEQEGLDKVIQLDKENKICQIKVLNQKNKLKINT